MTHETPPTFRNSIRPLLSLALPIIGVNVGMMLMGAVDIIMVGRVSPEALAAVALGNVYFFAISLFCIGVLLALDPILSQAIGAGDHAEFSRGVQRGIVLAMLLGIPASISFLFAEPLMAAFGQPTEVIPLIGDYAVALVPGIIPFLIFTAGRQTLQAMHRVAPILITIAITNVLNAALNYWLIFGGLGVPPLGVTGAALASTVSRITMAVLVLTIGWRYLRASLTPWHPDTHRWRPLLRMLRLGLPIGVQLEIEMLAFSIVALLMGTFGTVEVAGHQIALNLASLTFMVPMGVGMSAAVLVGRGVGAGDPTATRASARAALAVGFGFMTLTALLFLAVPYLLARLYSSDAVVVAFAAMLLPIAGVFQVFDGLQVVAAGILRGMGDTRAPMIINLIGFAGIGLGASWLLAFHTSLGPAGLWWGLVIGLATVAIILVGRVRIVLRRPLRRFGA